MSILVLLGMIAFVAVIMLMFGVEWIVGGMIYFYFGSFPVGALVIAYIVLTGGK